MLSRLTIVVSVSIICLTFAASCGDNLSGVAGECGNGVVNDGEECDDSNNTDRDGCSAGCLLDGVCGDGIITSDEECDDSNAVGGDGCSALCQNEATAVVCGDGIVGGAEACDDGNADELDGCEDDCTVSPDEIACFDLPPATAGVCDVTAGNAARLIKGDIMTPSTILRGGQVAVDDAGQITCVGCDCEAQAAGATVLTCPDAVVSPGLINPHDHITFVNNTPYIDTGERYEHRHDWRRGRNGHTEIDVNSGANSDEIRYGELRFMLGGATSVIGAGQASGFLRNLDRDAQEGLGQPEVELDVFPLGDGSGTQLSDGCGYGGITDDAEIASYDSYSPHVSEGIDAFARNEFLCLSRTDNGGEDLLEAQSAFIHGAGLTPIDYTRMTDQGTLLIWSPRSNMTLYGNTATVTTADRLGVPIALGTDWIPTGSMNLLRELQCADSLNQTYYGGHFDGRTLWQMVTWRAAQAAAMDDAIGVLLPGRAADIAIFDAATNVDYRAIIDAEPQDVSLVMRGGEALYGDENIMNSLASSNCDAIDVCSSAKRLCTSDEIGMTLAELRTAVGPSYELFFCGTTPTDEPSCVPTRPASVNGSTIYTGSVTETDDDGDGIENAGDNCPAIFNPIRPLDNGAQADFDGDGEGDACDECPMDSGITACLPFNEADPDADGVLTDADNCPELANDDQADGDVDGKGDVCDACPAQANAGEIACPATIYEIKTGATGSLVSMSDVLVSACVEASGFFLQVHEAEAGYAGAENSGVFVFNPSTDCGVTVSAGDRINITPNARVGNFFGQVQLSFATVAIVTNDNPLPTPQVLTPAQASGDVANALEGILASVEDVAVTEINPPAGPGDSNPTNAFVVDDLLRVDDFIFLTAAFPSTGAIYESITGVLAYRNNRQKLHPRAETDLVPGPPVLTAFAPAASFIRVGDAATASIPTPLTVTLSSPPVADTLVAIASNDAGLTVQNDGVTVLAGETSATVLLNGVAQAPDVTLTASFNGDDLTASVRVIGAAEVNTVSSLAPDGQTISPLSMLEMTVTLDFPAGAGGETLALSVTGSSSVPATVAVAEDTLSATFMVTAGAAEETATVTATLGASSATADFTIVDSGGLVINEIDYDQPGGDTLEFIEIFNGTAAAVDLSDFALVLANGSNSTQYIEFVLAGTLAPGQYLVIGSALAIADAAPESLTIDFGVASIQNGAPDGVGLFQISTGLLVDAIAYENSGGGMTNVTPDNFDPVSFVEGTASDVTDPGVVGSIGREPNATDTDDSAADWAFSTTATPGAANVP